MTINLEEYRDNVIQYIIERYGNHKYLTRTQLYNILKDYFKRFENPLMNGWDMYSDYMDELDPYFEYLTDTGIIVRDVAPDGYSGFIYTLTDQMIRYRKLNNL